ncbi:MAG: arsenosugar biosynthesis-associated peroxidase-like protein, partial [Bacteroidota bacterium]
GRLLIFGGVYSNLHALQALRAEAERMGIPPTHIICTGDIAGYCAFPDECLQMVKEWGIHAIVGNVEENIRDGLEDCGCGFGEDSACDLFSRMWYPYAKANTSPDSVDYIAGLPAQLQFSYAGQRGRVLHGNLEASAEFVWRSTDWSVKARSLKASGADFILSGHCGLPFIHQENGKSWINAGVIGMPANDGTQDVWYLTLDDADGDLQYEFHRLAYDHVAARAAMLEQPLPKSYALTLKTGIWDNTEIMPPTEAGWEGIALPQTLFTAYQSGKAPEGMDLREYKKEQTTASGTGQAVQSKKIMTNPKYYDPKDLKRFGQIKEFQEEMGEQFFNWYENATHGDTALTQREKALIALAVSHALHCPYCVDAYTTASLESGADEEQMMEAVHVAAAVKAGSTLIYGMQMKRQVEKLTM